MHDNHPTIRRHNRSTNAQEGEGEDEPLENKNSRKASPLQKIGGSGMGGSNLGIVFLRATDTLQKTPKL
jgi:hypothetical protein